MNDRAVDTDEPLARVLRRAARDAPDSVAFRWRDRPVLHRELADERRRLATGLAADGVRGGDRVVLALADGPTFLAALLGVQDLGAVPIPVAAGSGDERLRRLATRFGAGTLLIDRPDSEDATGSTGPTLRRRTPTGLPIGPEPRELDPDPAATAFVQPTSGTTGDPKGVVLSHRSLATNAAQLAAGLDLSARDVFYSWLPLHHDMGLVMMALTPLALGADLHLHPPGGSALRRWMPGMAASGATVTAGPDFAYRLARKLTRDPRELDLSRLRVALDAAEPVRASTVLDVEADFGLGRVLTPAYGLAEATVGVASSRPGDPLRVDPDGTVCVGRGFPGVELSIRDPEGRELPVGCDGEITVRTPSRCDGYLDDPEATAQLFDGGVLHTGDLGRLDAEGRLFVVDRLKDVILMGGETFAPRELEELAESVPWVRRADAVGIDRGALEGEQATVFAEVDPVVLRRRDPHELAVELTGALREALGQRSGRVVLLRPGSLPRTPNGKAMRRELRQRWLDGRLRADDRVVWPDSPAS